MGKVLVIGSEKLMTFILVLFFIMQYFTFNNNAALSGIVSNFLKNSGYSLDNMNSDNSQAPSNNPVAAISSQYGQEFNKAIAFTLQHEGGLVNDKADKGGITNFGISYNYLHQAVKQDTSILSLLSLSTAAQVTPSIIKNLTLQQAIGIYYNQWWVKYHFGTIENQAIASKVFDYAVNMGAGQAIKLLQNACQQNGQSSQITVNGQLDNTTVAYINNLNSTQLTQLLSTYETVASNYYSNIAKAHPTDKKFLVGWLHRANDNSSLSA